MKPLMFQNNENEVLEQLEDLIEDRKSFLGNDIELNKMFQKDIDALETIVYNYKMLKKAICHDLKEKGEDLSIWINENVKLRKVEILNVWETDYNDIRCNVNLYENKKPIANIIVSMDLYDINCIAKNLNHYKNNPEFFQENAIKFIIYDSFDKYLKLPKISKCSTLLKEIYDCVCESDASMCHITDEDWKEYYSERFTNKDFENLKKEIQILGLEDVIGINDCEYKIVGYGDLETKFNDNRNLGKRKEREKF